MERLSVFAIIFVKLPPPFGGFTSSALLWEAKASVVANNAYYALSLLSKRESFSSFFNLQKLLLKLLLLAKGRWIQSLAIEDGGG